MDVKYLIGEVAKKIHVLLDPQDPIFVTVALNEVLLAEHLRILESANERARDAAEEDAERYSTNVRRQVEQAMLGGAAHAQNRIRKAGDVVVSQILGALEPVLSELWTRAAEVNHRHRQCQMLTALSAVAAVAIAVSILSLRFG